MLKNSKAFSDFDNTDGQQTDYECIRVVSSPAVSHYKHRRQQTRGTN